MQVTVTLTLLPGAKRHVSVLTVLRLQEAPFPVSSGIAAALAADGAWVADGTTAAASAAARAQRLSPELESPRNDQAQSPGARRS